MPASHNGFHFTESQLRNNQLLIWLQIGQWNPLPSIPWQNHLDFQTWHTGRALRVMVQIHGKMTCQCSTSALTAPLPGRSGTEHKTLSYLVVFICCPQNTSDFLSILLRANLSSNKGLELNSIAYVSKLFIRNPCPFSVIIRSLVNSNYLPSNTLYYLWCIDNSQRGCHMEVFPKDFVQSQPFCVFLLLCTRSITK